MRLAMLTILRWVKVLIDIVGSLEPWVGVPKITNGENTMDDLHGPDGEI